MRQANFPDQKALTARDETNSEPNQPNWAGPLKTVVTYCSAWAAQRQRTPTRKHSLSLNLPLTDLLATLITALVKCVEGSSVPVRSRHLLMQSCHTHDPDSIFPESHPPHIFTRWPWLYNLTASWLDPFRMDTNSATSYTTKASNFPWSIPESPWQEDHEHLHCWTYMGAWGNVQGVRLLHSKTTEPTSVWCRAQPAQFLCTDYFPPFCGF